ncbi:hypothetical protein [Streptomyces sp. NPDC003374]
MSTTLGNVKTGRTPWTDKTFHAGAGPNMRGLAAALQALCRCLTPDTRDRRAGKRLTQARAAARIPCADSCLSRYLSGESLPAFGIVAKLHAEACQDAGGEEFVSVTVDELRLLHSQAELERRCRGCTDLMYDVNALKAQLSEAETECGALRQRVQEQEAGLSELAALREEVAVLRAAAARESGSSRAGSQAHPGVRTSPRPLPVPRRRGDRQRMRRDVAAMRSLTEQAKRLDAEGRPGAALTLLRRSSEILSPGETAGVLLLLREQQHDDLADNLIHIYGRDQEARSVLHLALSLHEQGSADDAGAILQAALDGTPASRRPSSAR